MFSCTVCIQNSPDQQLFHNCKIIDVHHDDHRVILCQIYRFEIPICEGDGGLLSWVEPEAKFMDCTTQMCFLWAKLEHPPLAKPPTIVLIISL